MYIMAHSQSPFVVISMLIMFNGHYQILELIKGQCIVSIPVMHDQKALHYLHSTGLLSQQCWSQPLTCIHTEQAVLSFHHMQAVTRRAHLMHVVCAQCTACHSLQTILELACVQHPSIVAVKHLEQDCTPSSASGV